MIARLDLFTFRGDQESRKPRVDADLPSGIGRFEDFGFTKDRGVVFTRRVSGDRDLPGFPFQGPVADNSDWSHLGDSKPVSIQAEVLRYLEGLMPLLFLEGGESRSFIEKVVVGGVQVSQRLLKGLGIHLLQPGILREFLELCQFGSRIVIGQAGTGFGIVINPLRKWLNTNRAHPKCLENISLCFSFG